MTLLRQALKALRNPEVRHVLLMRTRKWLLMGAVIIESVLRESAAIAA